MNDYDKIDNLALAVRMDYGFVGKRLDVFELAGMLGIRIIKYSQLNKSQRNVIENQCFIKDAMTVFDNHTHLTSCYLFYNEKQNSARIRFSIAHEIKHILCLERNPTDREEALADHFARVLLAPSCLLIYEGYKNAIDIASDFDISFESACHALDSARRRKSSPKFCFSESEKEFIRLYKDNPKK